MGKMLVYLLPIVPKLNMGS